MSGKITDLRQAANMQNTHLLAAIKTTIAEVSKSLEEDLAIEVLPENVFVEFFLDYFKNPKDHADSIILSKWIELAGGPYRSVNIIDDTGSVLYVAPSAMMPVIADFDGLSKYNFNEIVANYFNYSRITSVQGDNYLASALSGVDDKLRTDINSRIMQWKNIFARYEVKEEPDSIHTPSKKSIDLGIFGM